MRPTTRALIQHYVTELDLHGDVLEIGGHRLAKCAATEFPPPGSLTTTSTSRRPTSRTRSSPTSPTCRATIPDASFDVVFSSDVFEHIDRPWLVAEEIGRILKPGGIAITWTLFSWRNHPCPIDYWRYSAECLTFLFGGLALLEKGYDLSDRRADQPGFWGSGMDSVPVDQLGGWREHWAVYHVGRKGVGPAVAKFKTGNHPSAHFLRMDTQGVVTSPRLLGQEAPTIARRAEELIAGSTSRVEAAQADLASTLDGLTQQVLDLSSRLDQVSRTLAHPRRPTCSASPAASVAASTRSRPVDGRAGRRLVRGVEQV